MPIRPAGLYWFRQLSITFVSIAAAIPFCAQGATIARRPWQSSKDVEIVFLWNRNPGFPMRIARDPRWPLSRTGRLSGWMPVRGVVRQANSAFQRGIPALRPVELDIAFPDTPSQ